MIIAEITRWLKQDGLLQSAGEKETGRELERGYERVPSYHAASIEPLIFAALRFCLALSTLHTSTADRSHKTLYPESAESRETFGRRCPIVHRWCIDSLTAFFFVFFFAPSRKPTKIIKTRRPTEKSGRCKCLCASVSLNTRRGNH